MHTRTFDCTLCRLATGVSAIALALAACTQSPPSSSGGTTATTATSPDSSGSTTASAPPSADGTTTTTTTTTTSETPPDTDPTGDALDCAAGGPCPLIDVVIIVDNSGSMGLKQLNLARSFDALVDELRGLQDADGQPLHPDVNIMVTTTDMGHPLCTAAQPPGYAPRSGAPVYEGCNARIERFTGLDPANPLGAERACTENCPADIRPDAHFIHFNLDGSNVPDDDPAAALACIGPQGIDGCGYESPLEVMLRSTDPAACWNDPERAGCDDEPEWSDATEGALRDGATLAIVLFTDELDCSVQAPDGYSYFTDIEQSTYWNTHPNGIQQATSAVCVNAGVTCSGDTNIYDGCVAAENDVLQPISRYTQYLDELSQTRDVVMLSITGVPPVVARNPAPPYQPIAGGAVDITYRTWIDFPYPAGDVLPEQWDAGINAAHKIFEFGHIAPGCIGLDEGGEATSQGYAPVRIREVCEHLDRPGDDGEVVTRCCMESVCSDDFSDAFRCLGGTLSEALGPA